MTNIGTGRAAAARLLTLILAMTTVVPGRAGETPDDVSKALFEARYSAVRAAMATRDPNAITPLLAADFVSEDADGQVTSAARMIQDVVALPKDPNKVSSTTVLDVKIAGEVATVRQRYRTTTVRAPGGGAQEQHIEIVAQSTDTWIKQAGTWILTKTVTETLDYMVDGKLVVHKVHAPRPGD